MLKYLRMGNKRIKVVWWILIILTVGTFLGLFVTAFDPRYAKRVTNAVAMVDGTPVTQSEFAAALSEQRAQFQRQTGGDPGDQEQRMLEAQAWRSTVMQRLMDNLARRNGLKAHDPEVLLQLRVSPPPALANIPELQTNGKFDPQKYATALANPNANWAPFEEQVREQLPGRKLEERLAASLKLSQPELEAYYHDRFDRVSLTVAQVIPVTAGNVPPATDAEIDTVYRLYGSRMSGSARVQAEVLRVRKTFSQEDLRAAREQAQAVADRARRGEDFATLARDFSEGPGAHQGGVINRVFQPSDFGPALAPKVAAMKKGDVSDPFEDNGRLVIIKVLDRVSEPASPVPGFKVAQILIRARTSDDSRRAQYQKLDKVRNRAKTVGLGKAASEAGLSTTRTGYFDATSGPPELADTPEAADWAVNAKVGAVSRVFESQDAFSLAAVVEKHPAGPGTKTELMDALRQLAEYRKRTLMAKPAADRIAALVASGRRLEDAAKEAGGTPFTVDTMTRMQPDRRLMAVPEVQGVAFAAPIGKVMGPIQTPGGWFLIRVDSRSIADPARLSQELRGQLTTELLSRRQQEFFAGWIAEVRERARVEDLRGSE